MRKPPEIKKVTGQHISRNTGKSVSSGNKPDLYEVLGKLDGQQLVQLSQAAVGLVGEVVQLGSEREKTRQVEIQAGVRYRELDVEQHRDMLQYNMQMEEVAERREGQRLSHERDMKALENEDIDATRKHAATERVLDLIEAGRLTADQVIALIATFDRE